MPGIIGNASPIGLGKVSPKFSAKALKSSA